MDSLFENQYVITEKVYDEYFAYFYFRKPAAIAGMVCCMVAIAFAIAVSLMLGRLGILPVIAIIVVVLFFAMQIGGYLRARKLYYKLDLQQNGGRPVEIKIVAGPDGALSFKVPDGEENRLEYANISKIIETKNLLIVIAKMSRPFVFERSSFTKGNFEDLKAFIQGERVKNGNKKAA